MYIYEIIDNSLIYSRLFTSRIGVW